MVAIHITTETEKNAEKIVYFLIKEKMILEASLISNAKTIFNENAQPEIKKSTLIIALTRALLFKTICTKLEKLFPSEQLTIYSTPVIDMDLNKQKNLIELTPAV